MSHDLKSIRKQFKANGVFYSDDRMAELLKSLVPSDIGEVYDPTCGDGNLLAVFPDEVVKYGQELDPAQAAIASERLTNAVIASGDTLGAPAFADLRFKAIVSNYPFSVKWSPPANHKEDPVFAEAPCVPPPGRADYAFLLHILHCLDDEGTAAVVNFPGVCYRGQKERILRQWMIENRYIEKMILMEGGYFVDTKISTVIMVLRKNRAGTSILMRDNALDLEREVGIEEIRKNDYSLSISSYVSPPEPERPSIDPLALERKAQEGALQRIRTEINFSLMVAEMEGWSIEPFLDAIHDVINEFRLQPTLF